jgi:hypothetical protein
MDSFFDRVEPQLAVEIAEVSRRMYDVREARKRLLADASCADVNELIAGLREGQLPEHPSYEAWLAAQLMRQHEDALQKALHWHCCIANGESGLPSPPRTGLAALAEALKVADALPAAFEGSMQLHADGLAFHSADGIDALVRILSPDAWSFEWRWMGELWRLDTSPVEHPGILSPAHLHRPDGTVVADPIPLSITKSVEMIVRDFLCAIAWSPTLGLP